MNIAARPDRPIDLTTDLVPLRLTPDQAVPLALLVSEAVTNAIKYGSGELGGRGQLRVALRRIEPDQAELQVVNTICPRTVHAVEPGSEGTGLGSQLVESFAMQLGGSLDRQSDDREYRLSVRFTVNPLVKAEERRASDQGREGRDQFSGTPAAAQ
jgi:two-component sensor histidine kinase